MHKNKIFIMMCNSVVFLLLFREDDRTILQACQKMGAKSETFQHIANSLKHKTAEEVSGLH